MTTRISLTMIVKNEAATLARCLASVRDLVDEIIVADTGSSDNTKDIAGQLGARVFDLPWPDSFAAARNESIRHASGQWLLWLDGDEHLDELNREELRRLRDGLGDDNIAYALKCVCVSGQPGASATVVNQVRLFRNHPALRWDYRVHEQILPALNGVFTSIDAGLQGPLVRHHLAVLDREEGHLADAESHWRSILDDTPDFHLARLGLAELYLRQERWPEMKTLLAELQPHAPLDTAVLQARMNLARQDFATARQLLEDAMQKAPQFLAAHVLLSHVLLQSGDERAAEPQLRRIVEMDPGQAESWRNLAVLYRRTARLREAVAAAKAGCLHCPHDVDLLLLQGALLREGGDALNAETCLLRMLEMATGNGPAQRLRTTARQHLIALYRGLGRHREAEAHNRALVSETPELVHLIMAALRPGGTHAADPGEAAP